MTKPIISALALTLYDEGKFGLDDPISNYLPEQKERKVLENGKFVRAKTPITPRMLMSHSGGLYCGRDANGNGIVAVGARQPARRGRRSRGSLRRSRKNHGSAVAARPTSTASPSTSSAATSGRSRANRWAKS
jgi:CubicO group peptidase (beta-lactamase class C family)